MPAVGLALVKNGRRPAKEAAKIIRDHYVTGDMEPDPAAFGCTREKTPSSTLALVTGSWSTPDRIRTFAPASEGAFVHTLQQVKSPEAALSALSVRK